MSIKKKKKNYCNLTKAWFCNQKNFIEGNHTCQFLRTVV